MDNKKKLKDSFNFIVVDDSPYKIEMIKDKIKIFGIEPTIITDEDYAHRTFKKVSETYEENKIPVLFLDEKLGLDILEDGNLIGQYIVENFGEKGGIIFPCSTIFQMQVRRLESSIEDRKEWYIEQVVGLGNREFISNVAEICREYQGYVEKRESNSDIKNG
ncbi:hypothetical protein A2400_01135 [candidate division WS6 bacterium RIFOXYB1_FULL_33_14]|uniref:Response regulatory domain-containing protein n=1 Tax=candidate division WS6 bacterium RIFOXYB1_FULL_33_14 TaxID=1817896 RepID=A0A1F4UHC9_9BACT|nr:MAG: hypothetical protein A2400_01135 [candidate division WS6 bacterium RIFOXYB1_FULL_33_14]